MRISNIPPLTTPRVGSVNPAGGSVICVGVGAGGGVDVDVGPGSGVDVGPGVAVGLVVPVGPGVVVSVGVGVILGVPVGVGVEVPVGVGLPVGPPTVKVKRHAWAGSRAGAGLGAVGAMGSLPIC